MSLPGGPCREKYWSEKTDQEKIIILGEAVDLMAKRMIEMEDTLMRLLQHDHHNGALLVPLRYEALDIPYWMKNPLRREMR